MNARVSTVRGLAMVCVVLFSSVITTSRVAASSDVVLEWNAIAVNTMVPTQSPFGQARLAAITQLAVFEAVNAVTGDYQPYLGTIDAPDGASAEAAAAAAAHAVLKNYFPSAATLDADRASSLATIPDSAAKTNGIATGVAAATAMIVLRRTTDRHLPPTRCLGRSFQANGRRRRAVRLPAGSSSTGRT